MVDIHSHILPFVDDGSNSVQKSIEMLRIAEASSTEAVVLTPHSNLYEYEKNLIEEMTAVFDSFKAKLENENVDIEVYLGAEVYASDDIIELAHKKQLPTINNSRFMLVEFDFYASSGYITGVLSELSKLGYVPIVAHPERYECVKKRISAGLEFMNCGALLQINKGSFVNDFGVGARNTAFELVHHRLAHFVASDAHNLSSRNPDMELCFDILRDEFDDKYARKLFEINPRAVIENKKLLISRPVF